MNLYRSRWHFLRSSYIFGLRKQFSLLINLVLCFACWSLWTTKKRENQVEWFLVSHVGRIFKLFTWLFLVTRNVIAANKSMCDFSVPWFRITDSDHVYHDGFQTERNQQTLIQIGSWVPKRKVSEEFRHNMNTDWRRRDSQTYQILSKKRHHL